MKWPWPCSKRRDEAAADRLASAEQEVEISRQRLHETHEKVVKPLRRYAERNGFADILASSLAEGRRGKGAA